MKIDHRALIAIGFIVIISFGAFALSMTPHVSGWEVENDIYNIRTNGVTYPVMESGSRPENVYLWTTKGIRFDVDIIDSGAADIDVSLGPPREKVLDTTTGEWVNARDAEVFKTYSKSVNNTYYFWDHHVFFFEVTIVATPDFHDYYIGNIVPGDVLPSVVQRTLGEAEGMEGAEDVDVLLKLNFKLDPWVNFIIDQISDNDTKYSLDEEKIWTGIMSAQILEVETMFVGWGDPDTDPPSGEIDPYQVGGAQLSILTDEGTYSNTTTRADDELVDKPSDMAPSECQIAVGGTMFPGWCRELGGTSDIYPTQLKYKVRMDALSTAGYDLIDGSMDDVLDNKSYKKGSTKPVADFWTNLKNGLEDFNAGLQDLFGEMYGPLVMIAIIAVVALVFYLLLKLGILRRGTGG
jgi:hypothetical protein